MDIAEALSRMETAHFWASMAFVVLAFYPLSLFLDWVNRQDVPAGQMCQQHGKPRHECRDEHRD